MSLPRLISIPFDSNNGMRLKVQFSKASDGRVKVYSYVKCNTINGNLHEKYYVFEDKERLHNLIDGFSLASSKMSWFNESTPLNEKVAEINGLLYTFFDLQDYESYADLV